MAPNGMLIISSVLQGRISHDAGQTYRNPPPHVTKPLYAGVPISTLQLWSEATALEFGLVKVSKNCLDAPYRIVFVSE